MSGQTGPSIFLTTSNTQSNKLSLLIQLTPKNIKIKTKVRSQQIQCKGYVNSVSKRKAQPMSWANLPAFLVIFLPTNGNFEDLNMSKSQLNQKIQYKIQYFPIQFFFSIL